jgi:ABC-2 type transport system ATP-binding protein
MPDCVIETRSLRKEFGDKVAVADLSLQIRRGEVFGFLGPNGAGKTTSLKLLLGLIGPTAGGGTMLGAPLGRREARERIGFLPEHFRFHDCLTGRELLRLHGELFGLRGRDLERRIDRLLARVDLADAADRQVKTYSKGMIQRAGLAQALINDPEIVFLDEPTSGLDPLGRLLVRGLIDEQRERGATVFLNSHLLGEVEATCDRVAFVKQGRVIRELALGATPAQLELEVRIDRADAATLAGLAAFGSALNVEDRVVRLGIAGESSVPEIARWLVTRGVALYELRMRRKSLEEWFIEIMGDDQRPG